MMEALAALPPDALLQPVWNVSSPAGFYYEGARSQSREEFAANLERLVEAGYAERVFVDRLSLCPSCGSHALNVREICPTCGSSHLDHFKALFHFRCGYTGPTTAFKAEPNGLRCPKCNRLLKDLGTDHDSPGTFLQCLSCSSMFQTAHVGGRCLNCSGRFDQAAMEHLEQRDVYAYRLTERGRSLLHSIA